MYGSRTSVASLPHVRLLDHLGCSSRANSTRPHTPSVINGASYTYDANADLTSGGAAPTLSRSAAQCWALMPSCPGSMPSHGIV